MTAVPVPEPTPDPELGVGIDQFTAISSGWDHSCGIRADGTAACWGDNHVGQSDAPEGVFTAISAGDMFSCAIRADGTVACWGDDHGDGEKLDAPEGKFAVA